MTDHLEAAETRHDFPSRLPMRAGMTGPTWNCTADPQFDPALIRGWTRLLLDMHASRTNYFPGGLFADPAWDMLLDLTHARLAGKHVSVSSLCIASGVPATTALRRITDLVETGLAVRIKDHSDGRRVFVELTDDGFARMIRYLDKVERTAAAKIGRPARRA
jgi:predicted transcriptional regulator